MKKKHNKAKKGPQFERNICHQLSQWWYPGRDDIFWRTAGSGARATTRSKKGKRTIYQTNDVTAIDPCGLPLIRLFAIELKKGYSKHTLHDLMDKPDKEGFVQVVEGWIGNCQKKLKDSESYSWMIIHERNRREPMVILPRDNKVWPLLKHHCPTLPFVEPFMKMDFTILAPDFGYMPMAIAVFPWKSFLEEVNKQVILKMYNDTLC